MLHSVKKKKKKKIPHLELKASQRECLPCCSPSSVNAAPPAEVNVHAVQPYTKDDLAKECLPDSLYLYSHGSEISRCTNPLLYLYPDIPRDEAFGHYYKLSGILVFCLTLPPCRRNFKCNCNSTDGEKKRLIFMLPL